MEIIALIGPDSCGKTTTLEIVWHSIQNQVQIISGPTPLRGNPHDFVVEFVLNGKRMILFTMGDFSKDLTDVINDADRQNIDTFICACNSKFVRPQALIVQYQHHILNKAQEPNNALHQRIDNSFAQQIIALI